MKLLDLLVKKTNEEGWAWPGKSTFCYQTKPEHGYITKFFDRNGVKVVDYCWEKCDDASAFNELTKEQYDSALAASEGWIEWGGGECPVEEGTLVDVRFRDGDDGINIEAKNLHWFHKNWSADIIAYRLQQPTKSEQVRADAWRSYAGITEKDDEADLNECIGQDVDMPEWNFDGLPPVGTICEYSLAGRVWSPCKIELYVGTQGVVISCDVFEGIQYVDFAKYDDFEFRPLRTEAERAREDAETAIRTCLAGTGAGITPLAAKGIYDAIAAGKIPGVKLDK